MSGQGGSHPTVDELVEVLRRSSLPSVAVEGTDDANIYRWIEQKISIANADVLPCGGREQLLHLFDRRSEYPRTKVVFLADQDFWLFDGVPGDYKDVILSTGYSIENDILCNSGIERLLERGEALDFEQGLYNLAKWFAFEVEEHRSRRECRVSASVEQLFATGGIDLNEDFLRERGFRGPDQAILETILQDPKRYIRGKQVLGLLRRILSQKGRFAKHSSEGLMEICSKTDGHPHIDRLISEIEKGLV
jgi:hypothetical protein